MRPRACLASLSLLAVGCGGISVKTPSGVHQGTVAANQGNRISLDTGSDRVIVDKCEIEDVSYPGNAVIWSGLGVAAGSLVMMGLLATMEDDGMPNGSPLTALPITAGGLLTVGIGLEVKNHAKNEAGNLECGGAPITSASLR